MELPFTPVVFDFPFSLPKSIEILISVFGRPLLKKKRIIKTQTQLKLKIPDAKTHWGIINQVKNWFRTRKLKEKTKGAFEDEDVIVEEVRERAA